MNLLHRIKRALFSVQTRESEIQQTVHTCVQYIINNTNDYTPHEKLRIAHRVQSAVESSIQEEQMEIIEELNEYEKALGLDK